MKTQPGKGAKPAVKSTSKAQKSSGEVDGAKMEEELEDDDIDTPTKSGKIAAGKDEDDDDDDIADDADSWEKPEEGDDDWDPDFDEFDVPKSGAKSIGKKGAKEEDDEFKIDDDFKDMFNDSGYDDKDDDDY